MTEQANPSVVAHWLQLQQQYWEMWLNLAQQLTETSTTEGNQVRHPWRDVLDLYWQTLEPSFTPEVRAIVHKFIDQGKNFSQFNNALLTAVQNAANTEQPTPWLNTWQANFGDMYNNFSKFVTEKDSPLNVWQLLHSNWWRMMMFTVPMSPMSFESLDGGLRENLEKLLTLPTLGYTREWQHKWQNGIKLWRTFQTAQQEYSKVLNKISLRSIELLRERATDFTENSESSAERAPKTMRAIYDLWVECGEQAYAECVRTEEYIQAHANVINSLMACKYYEQEMTDELLSALNMPTRRELDTFSLRMQQMRRELKILQAKQVTTEIDALTCQVNVLRAELETLKAAKSAPAPATPPAKAVAAPKTPATHKPPVKKTPKKSTTTAEISPAPPVTAVPDSFPAAAPTDADKQGK